MDLFGLRILTSVCDASFASRSEGLGGGLRPFHAHRPNDSTQLIARVADLGVMPRRVLVKLFASLDRSPQTSSAMKAAERGGVPYDNICRRIARVFRGFLERRSDCDYGVVMVPGAQPKSERLKQAVMAALQAAGGTMQIVNLNKALFYVDLVALRDFGATLTGQEYLALENGPVVMNYDRRIVETLVNAGCAVQEQDPSGYGKPLRVTAPMDEFTALSDDELKLVRSVAKYVVKQTAKSLSDLSHNNPGWRLAYRGKGARAEAINMRIALQQLDDNDADDNAWLRAPLSDDEKTAVAAAAGDDGVPWGRSAGAGR